MSAPVAAIVCSSPRSEDGRERPGGVLPYGLGALEPRFEMRWVDGHHQGWAVSAPMRRVEGAVRRFAPSWRGLAAAHHASRALPDADVVLSVFEDAGLGLARRQSLLAPASRTPHVMVVCWLAEDAKGMPRARRTAIARALDSVSAVCVFSSNQADVLCDAFSIPPDRIRSIPFGVDTAYYDPSRVDAPSGGAGVVAVGSDSRRDYATLFAAAERGALRMKVACAPRNIVGLEVPAGVELVTAYDEEYRQLLHAADVVVTATTAPEYPSGQTVVLEAMSMARATVTTDSSAMRGYVTAGVTGMLVPSGDAGKLAERIAGLLDDPAARASLGRSAQQRVRKEFAIADMWHAVGDVMAEVVRSAG